MGSTREKGKIHRSEWPKILARYNGGETIASIGRAYGCTAPAIRYIVKRSGTLKGEPERRGVSEGAKASRQPTSRSNLRPVGSGDAAEPVAVRRGPRTGAQILGQELRKRVSSDVASFLVAFDQVVLEGSIGSLAELQEATDRLMRSTARVRLELERAGYEGAEAQRDVRETATSTVQRDA